MKPLSVNFAWQRKRLPDRAGWTLLTIAAGFGALLAWHRFELVREFEAGEAEHARLERPLRSAGHSLSADEQALTRAEMRLARRVIEQLDAPWDALFAAVETAYDDNVTLLGVEPEPERREVRLLAESKDTQAMLAYVRQVRQSPVLKDAWLANHQVNLQDPLRPVRFSINARWVSPPAAAVQPTAGTEDADKKLSVASAPIAAPDGKAAP